MTLFWAICALMLLVALLFVVLPLWRNTGNKNDVLRDTANLEILRDQSAELEADLLNGLLTQDGYEQGKRELQARLLEEVKTTGQPPVKLQHNPAKVLAMVLAVLLPLFSVLLYLKIGSANSILVAGNSGNLSPEAALHELERKVERQPDDPNNLVMLARSYSELQRFPDAVRAYGQLLKLVPEEAQVWAEYADVYAMINNKSLLGEPEKFISKALELDGNNSMALDLSGAAAMQHGDYVTAITQWQKMMSMLPPNSQYAQTIRDSVQQARGMLAQQKGGKDKLAKLPADKAPEKATAGPAPISGKVALSPALAGKVAPEDVMYIFARDTQGQKTLRAVLRKQVKDLPLNFTLDDTMAMQPQAKLSGSDRVTVVARISKTGNPAAQPGDMQGSTGVIKPGTKGVNIVIDSVVP
ncbi:MAG: c-type cytochrome biogenesis protein CcmI [Gallionellales bacterium RIFCSPHIGHO2_02_FULL_57_16]|nr:MAG: c-type cytochrome biogenesis protein CcmI [Gallionellales bacterium RIFCSPHIGHO2_02_FULL_57_16]